MTWQSGMRKCTANFGKVGVSRLVDYFPEDSSTGWLLNNDYDDDDEKRITDHCAGRMTKINVGKSIRVAFQTERV